MSYILCCLFVCLFVYLFVCLFVCLSVGLFVCLFVCLYFFLVLDVFVSSSFSGRFSLTDKQQTTVIYDAEDETDAVIALMHMFGRTTARSKVGAHEWVKAGRAGKGRRK